MPMYEDPVHARSEWLVRVFDHLLHRRLRCGFNAVRIAHPQPKLLEVRGPLVVYCNHPSWWDAALMPVLMRRMFPDRHAFAPIDAKALERYRFMARLGFFGVQVDSYQGALTFLRVGQRVMGADDALLGVTPHGVFSDPRERPVRLRPGLATLIARVPSVTVVPVALEYPFWEERTPEALVRIGEPMTMGRAIAQPEVRSIHHRLEEALQREMDALAIDARSRDPSRFSTLITGKAGVGGIYDGWRRLRAWGSGDRFDPRHGPRPVSHGGAGR